MERRHILLTLTTIAAVSTIYWAFPPFITGSEQAGWVCGLWGCVNLAGAATEDMENWAYRLSSFLGFMFLTIEGCMGLFLMVAKPYLLLFAFLHGVAFVLAIVGRWKKVASRRPRRSLDDALAEARSQVQDNPST